VKEKVDETELIEKNEKDNGIIKSDVKNNTAKNKKQNENTVGISLLSSNNKSVITAEPSSLLVLSHEYPV